MSIHDRWQGDKPDDGRMWEVRWREAGRQRKRRFDTKAAAQAWDAKRRLEPEIRLAREGRSLTVDQMMDTWLATKAALRPKTLDAYGVDRREILATFGGRLASAVRPSEIRTWMARDRGISLRRRSLTALSQAYRIAVADGLLAVNPCAGVRQPSAVKVEVRALTWDELRALAEHSGRHAPMIWLMGTCGLRLGEAIGLQIGDVNLTTGRIRVARAVVDTSHGRVVGPPKSGKGRDVAVPRSVLEQLPLAGRQRDAWLFTGVQGGRLDGPDWRRRDFKPAALAAGLGDLHPHQLRHTAASLAIAAGADVMAVQRLLGHASASITLSIYAHLGTPVLTRLRRG